MKYRDIYEYGKKGFLGILWLVICEFLKILEFVGSSVY